MSELHSQASESATVSEARHRLAALRWARSDHYRRHRARQRMKKRYLWWIGAVLAVLLLPMGFFLRRDQGVVLDDVLLTAFAGAVGATVSGTYKLRDELVRGSELREFSPAIVVQPLLGAAAALFVLLVLESGMVEVAGTEGWAKRGAIGFVAVSRSRSSLESSDAWQVDQVRRTTTSECPDACEVARDGSRSGSRQSYGRASG
jgi:hypothetical protein